MNKIPNFENSGWRTWQSFNFDEIWYTDADFDSKNDLVTKFFPNSKRQNSAILKTMFWLSRRIIVQLTLNFDK